MTFSDKTLYHVSQKFVSLYIYIYEYVFIHFILGYYTKFSNFQNGAKILNSLCELIFTMLYSTSIHYICMLPLSRYVFQHSCFTFYMYIFIYLYKNVMYPPFWHLMSLGRYIQWMFCKKWLIQLHNSRLFYYLVVASYLQWFDLNFYLCSQFY